MQPPPHGPGPRPPPGYAAAGAARPSPHGPSPGYPVPPARTSGLKVLGCALAVVAALGLAFVGFFVVIFLVAMSSIKSSDAYRASVQLLSSHPVVVADTGVPVEPGLLPSGSIETGTGGGSAELEITLSGPKGEGEASIVARKVADRWQIQRATWTANGRSTELIPPGP